MYSMVKFLPESDRDLSSVCMVLHVTNTVQNITTIIEKTINAKVHDFHKDCQKSSGFLREGKKRQKTLKHFSTKLNQTFIT